MHGVVWHTRSWAHVFATSQLMEWAHVCGGVWVCVPNVDVELCVETHLGRVLVQTRLTSCSTALAIVTNTSEG